MALHIVAASVPTPSMEEAAKAKKQRPRAVVVSSVTVLRTTKVRLE